jgi:alkylation response protein AidB-like acyl-CoA dehydrogenase
MWGGLRRRSVATGASCSAARHTLIRTPTAAPALPVALCRVRVGVGGSVGAQHRQLSSAAGGGDDGSALFSPTEVHSMLRESARQCSEEQVDPQALEHDKHELFNHQLFKRLGEQGYLGVTVPEEYGGTGLDATASAIVHEELSAADPGFCLAYLAHSLLFCNNLAVNGSPEQCAKYLPAACAGDLIGGMCMSEPGAGTDVLGCVES